MRIICILCCILTGCGDSDSDYDPYNNFPELAPTIEVVDTAPPSNPICNKELSAFDGPGGFVWKPESDSGGTLVVILPERFVVAFEQVTVQRRDGRVERLRYAGFANGDRQHWRGVSAGREYLSESLVVAEERGNACAWRIGRAGARND